MVPLIVCAIEMADDGEVIKNIVNWFDPHEFLFREETLLIDSEYPEVC